MKHFLSGLFLLAIALTGAWLPAQSATSIAQGWAWDTATSPPTLCLNPRGNSNICGPIGTMTAGGVFTLNGGSGVLNPWTVPAGGTGLVTLTAHGVLVGEGIANVAVTSPGAAGQVLTSNGAAADPTFQNPAPSTVDWTLQGQDVRQTISGGPIDANGFPTFLPGTSASLAITSQNVTTSYPIAATAANGSASATLGQQNLNGASTTNLTWVGLTASTTNYLYVSVNVNGTLSTGFTTLVPIYQFGGTPSVTNNQFTFNISEMRGYMGNGATAPQANIVFVGEVVTGVGTVTSTIAYAYRGLYDSGYINTLPATGSFTSKNSNLGVVPRIVGYFIRNITPEFGYAAGDVVNFPFTASASQFGSNPIITTRNTIAFQGGPAGGTSANGLNKTTGAFVGFTNANWAYQVIAERGW